MIDWPLLPILVAGLLVYGRSALRILTGGHRARQTVRGWSRG